MFTPRKVAGMIRQHLLEELHRLQTRILLAERFADVAVTLPMLGRMGAENALEMKKRHDELVGQIKALSKAIDAASEADLMAFVESLKRRGL